MFAVNHAFPFSKMLTFYRKEPFDLEASYAKNVNLPLKDGFIGKLGPFQSRSTHVPNLTQQGSTLERLWSDS